MSYSAKILADSISPDGVRLTTFEVIHPRFILAEVNTHRMLSRNSASSRAIPTEKQIARVRENPFVPMTFNKRVKGMGVGEEFSEKDTEKARKAWLQAAEMACSYAEYLNDLGLDKSRANRLLEPFMWHTAIISATEWDNFFALRDHPAAQPEFQVVAEMMRKEMSYSTPQLLNYDQWHLPLVQGVEGVKFEYDSLKKISASRCARVSFDKHTDDEPISNTIARADKLMNSVPAHLSPFEHVARPADPSQDAHGDDGVGMEFYGNFRGWVQMRKEIPNEDNALAMIEAAA